MGAEDNHLVASSPGNSSCIFPCKYRKSPASPATPGCCEKDEEIIVVWDIAHSRIWLDHSCFRRTEENGDTEKADDKEEKADDKDAEPAEDDDKDEDDAGDEDAEEEEPEEEEEEHDDDDDDDDEDHVEDHDDDDDDDDDEEEWALVLVGE